MSTRCQIEILDGRKEERKGEGVLLYHHSDGYPEFQLEKLEKFLARVKEFLSDSEYPYWWDSERVAAIMIVLSVQGYAEPHLPSFDDLEDVRESCVPSYAQDESKRFTDDGVPVYQPCRLWHGDTSYLYAVELSGTCRADGSQDTRDYKIRVFRTNRSFDPLKGETPYGEEITDTWDQDEEE